ncbi:aminotransferase class III-fold pyridoxal phosphate-dependent enzyme [Cystobacter fuscus]
MGFGVHLFGHGAPFIKRALMQQLELGHGVGPQPERAGQLAELFTELTGAERVTFCQSGTESVMTALRLARTATGRNRIVLFKGSFHGHYDGVLAQAQGGRRRHPRGPGHLEERGPGRGGARLRRAERPRLSAPARP